MVRAAEVFRRACCAFRGERRCRRAVDLKTPRRSVSDQRALGRSTWSSVVSRSREAGDSNTSYRYKFRGMSWGRSQGRFTRVHVSHVYSRVVVLAAFPWSEAIVGTSTLLGAVIGGVVVAVLTRNNEARRSRLEAQREAAAGLLSEVQDAYLTLQLDGRGRSSKKPDWASKSASLDRHARPALIVTSPVRCSPLSVSAWGTQWEPGCAVCEVGARRHVSWRTRERCPPPGCRRCPIHDSGYFSSRIANPKSWLCIEISKPLAGLLSERVTV
jgi:hypothetical protein